MKIFEKIQADMYSAMKVKDTVKTKALRVALAKLKDKKIAERGDLTAEQELKVLQSMAKQHKESIAMFREGGRSDLVEQETNELQILEQYLPKMMTDLEIRKIVQSSIEESGALSMVDIGKVMPIIIKKGAGKIDGKKAQLFLREFLQ